MEGRIPPDTVEVRLLGACHGCPASGQTLAEGVEKAIRQHCPEIVHIQHSYASFIGRKLHPLGRRLQPPVGRRMQRAWLDFASKGWETSEIRWSNGHDWPVYDTENRFTRIIETARDTVVSDPDAQRRKAWAALS